jgi:glycosyltransferase involved in cell wall biosynthesis
VSRPRRVLQVIDSVVGGGAEQHGVDLAVALRERGWPMALACSVVGPPGPQRDAVVSRLSDHHIPVRPLMDRLVKRRVSKEYAARLAALVGELDPALVHAHIYASASAAARAVDSSTLPLVVTEHTEAPWRDAEARLESRAYYGRSDQILCVSRAIRTRLRTEYGVPPRTLSLMVPVGRTPPDTPPRARGCGGPPSVGYVGRLCPEKGVDLLIRAMPLLSRRSQGAHLVVVGDGPDERRLRRLAQDLGVGDCVAFLGHRDDVPALLRQMDVLAVPSRSDGAPLVIHEAMQAGTAVVGSAVGGIPDRLEDGRCGVLVPAGRVDALADALSGLLADADARRRLSRAARRAAARHTFAGMVDVVERAYADAVAARRGRSKRSRLALVPVPAEARRADTAPVGTGR